MPVAVVAKKALLLNLRNPTLVTKVLPKYQVVSDAGINYLAVPHTVDTWHVLDNLGVKVRGYEPMRYYYNYPRLAGIHNPMPSQSETAVFCTANKRCYVLNEMRTGKTASVLWASDYLRYTKHVKRTLILCTMSCVDVVWQQTLFSLFPQRTVAVLQGSAQRRLDLLKQNFDYYIVNHDGIKIGYAPKGKSTGLHKELMDLVEAGEINLIIVDEGSEFRNFSTDRWKALHAVAAKSPRVWWLTGTPDPNGPEDIWAQAKIVNPRLVPDYFGTWRDRTMLKVGLFKYVPRKGYEKSIHEAMQPAIRFKKSEVMELPPVTYQDRKAEATKEQEAAVKQIKAQGTIASANGAVSAVNAAVLLGKILQIQAGVVKTDAGQLVHYPTNNRLRVLDEIVEQSNAKVIVFAPYKAVVDLLVEHLKKYTTVDFIDGRVTGKARTSIIQAFQGQEHPRVLVAHPKTTGHGLELSAADTVVWYAPFHSVDLYEQANNRIMSGLQKRSMGVFHIYMTTLEHKIFEGLKAGVSMQQKVLQLYDEEVLGKVLTRELTTVTI